MDDEFDGEPFSDGKQAMYFFEHILKNWLGELKDYSDYYLVVSNGQNFRKGLYEDYKANRKDIKRHPSFDVLKERVMELDACIWEDNIEADDLIGIRCTEAVNTIAVSADKDFATIPCKLMIPRSHGRKHPEFLEFTEAQADRNWLIQTMTGDVIDNYKGIPGVGPKTAEKIIPHEGPVDTLWPHVRNAFLKAGQTEDQAITMARLARILRAGEYNFDTKEVNLWTPSN